MEISTSEDNSVSQDKPQRFLSRVWNSTFKNENSSWLEKERGNLVIAATIVAAMTYHAGLNPPRVMYFDSKISHSPGNVVQTEVNLDNFSQFVTLNTVPLIASLTSILLLVGGFNLRNRFFMWLLMEGMLTTFVFMIVTYVHSIGTMSPDSWVSGATFYACVIWILVCVLFGFIATLYFVVSAMVWRSISAKQRMENPIDI